MQYKNFDFLLSKSEIAIRKDFQKWLKNNLPSENERQLWFTDNIDLRYAAWGRWQRKLYDGGWMGLSWPVEYGGKASSLVSEFLIGEELAAHRAPYSGNWISLAAIANALLSFGTEEQKKKYLGEIARGECAWCLGVTEPAAGSNVMATETKAELIGDAFVVNGRKIWSTHSPRADRCLLLVKTGDHEKTEWNLSMLIVDLKSPGIEVKSLRQLHGEENYGEITFKNVRIPKENVVGGINNGWIVQAATWLKESVPPFDIPHRLGIRTLVSDIRRSKKNKNSALRQQIAKLAIEAEMVRLTTVRALRQQENVSGLDLPPTAPLIKVIFTETTQKITELGLNMSSIDDRISWNAKPINWLYKHLSARSNTIARAPSEIHRNFIARHYLGLPK